MSTQESVAAAAAAASAAAACAAAAVAANRRQQQSPPRLPCHDAWGTYPGFALSFGGTHGLGLRQDSASCTYGATQVSWEGCGSGGGSSASGSATGGLLQRSRWSKGGAARRSGLGSSQSLDEVHDAEQEAAAFQERVRSVEEQLSRLERERAARAWRGMERLMDKYMPKDRGSHPAAVAPPSSVAARY